MRDLRFVGGGVLLFLILTVGCSAERLAPRKVGGGAARLTVRNLAAITSLVSSDTTCGFSSEAVAGSFTLDGAIGEEGAVTWTVERCLINLGPLHEVKTDCNGDTTSIGGAVTVSGTKRIEGLLTGDPENPVVPTRADAVTLTLSADLSDFEVTTSTSDASLRMVSGSVAWEAQPHLAISATTGLCTIPTSDLSLANITYAGALTHLTSGKKDFDVHIPTSSFSAQIGKWGPRENWISGQITIRKKEVALPTPKDESPVLDVDYERERFVQSFSCTDDLQVPITYACKSLKPALAHGIARLTVPTFGNLARLIEKDTTCGFSSPAVLQAVQLTGDLGVDGGSATYQVRECVLDFPQPVVAAESCDGAQRIVQGRVTVTATKTLYGFRTGDPDNPIAPTSWEPAVITLRAVFDEHDAQDTGSGNTLTVHSGTLSGIVRPRAVIDTTTGVCSEPSGNAALSSLVWQNADLTLRTSSGSFRLHVDSSDLEAQVGQGDGVENRLTGRVTIDGEPIPIPIPGEAPDLDPNYDRQAFEDSWASCTPDIAIPRSDAECSFHRVLGLTAARLLTKTLGTMASVVNDDTACGYENTNVKLGPIAVNGQVGQTGDITWAARNCAIASGPATLYSTDCAGVETWYSGSATVWTHRTIRGELEQLGSVIDSVIPHTRDAIDMVFEDSDLSEFTVWDEQNGQKTLPAQLTIHSGALIGTVHPILGESATTAGVYDVVTPVSMYEQISVKTSLDATLEVQGSQFPITISGGSFDAMNGVWRGDGNRIEGTLIVNGESVPIGPAPLVPDFDQVAFNESYVCKPTLRGPIPHLP